MGRAEITRDRIWEIACAIARKQPRWIREDARQAAALAGLEALERGYYGVVVFMRMARAAMRERRSMEKPVPRGDMEDPYALTGNIRDFFLDMSEDERMFVEMRCHFSTMKKVAEELGWSKYKARKIRDALKARWEAR